MTRLGIVLYHGIDSGPELGEYGQIAEEAGFESLWVTERYFHEETFSLLGYLAAVTQRIKLGLGVANPYTRNPALLAMATATLDRISGGRFVLGLGRSDRAVIQDRMGIHYGDARASLEEAVGIVRALLSGQRVTSRDGRFRLTDARLAVKPRTGHGAHLSGRHRAQGPFGWPVPPPMACCSTPTVPRDMSDTPLERSERPRERSGETPNPSTSRACWWCGRRMTRRPSSMA